jgi:hypothetical protein
MRNFGTVNKMCGNSVSVAAFCGRGIFCSERERTKQTFIAEATRTGSFRVAQVLRPSNILNPYISHTHINFDHCSSQQGKKQKHFGYLMGHPSIVEDRYTMRPLAER